MVSVDQLNSSFKGKEHANSQMSVVTNTLLEGANHSATCSISYTQTFEFGCEVNAELYSHCEFAVLFHVTLQSWRNLKGSVLPAGTSLPTPSLSGSVVPSG